MWHFQYLAKENRYRDINFSVTYLSRSNYEAHKTQIKVTKATCYINQLNFKYFKIWIICI